MPTPTNPDTERILNQGAEAIKDKMVKKATKGAGKSVAQVATPTPKAKPIRVHTQDVLVMDHCPVCTEEINGQAVLEIHMAAPTSVHREPGSIGVNVETSTKVRSFTVRHDCTPKATS